MLWLNSFAISSVECADDRHTAHFSLTARSSAQSRVICDVNCDDVSDGSSFLGVVSSTYNAYWDNINFAGISSFWCITRALSFVSSRGASCLGPVWPLLSVVAEAYLCAKVKGFSGAHKLSTEITVQYHTYTHLQNFSIFGRCCSCFYLFNPPTLCYNPLFSPKFSPTFNL